MSFVVSKNPFRWGAEMKIVKYLLGATPSADASGTGTPSVTATLPAEAGPPPGPERGRRPPNVDDGLDVWALGVEGPPKIAAITLWLTPALFSLRRASADVSNFDFSVAATFASKTVSSIPARDNLMISSLAVGVGEEGWS